MLEYEGRGLLWQWIRRRRRLDIKELIEIEEFDRWFNGTARSIRSFGSEIIFGVFLRKFQRVYWPNCGFFERFLEFSEKIFGFL